MTLIKKKNDKKHGTETEKSSWKITSLCFKFKMNVICLKTFYKAAFWVIPFSSKQQMAKGP